MTNKSTPDKLDHLFGSMFDIAQGHVWGYDTFTIGRFCVCLCVCELNHILVLACLLIADYYFCESNFLL